MPEFHLTARPLSDELAALLKNPTWSLDHAALIISKLEDPNLDIGLYLERLDRLAFEFERQVASKRNLEAVVAKFIHFMAVENGFKGDEVDYFNPANAYLYRVIDSRKGIPIALAILYIEVARRIRLPILGIGMPGHFLLQVEPTGAYIDPFYNGAVLDEAACRKRFHTIYGEAAHFNRHFLRPLDRREILARLVNNLKGLFARAADLPKVLQLLDFYLLLYPDAAQEYLERGLVYRQLECFNPALRDFERYLETLPDDDGSRTQRERVMNEIATLRRLTATFH